MHNFEGVGMEQNQNALFERFHQAISSMEAQLISLYEERVQTGNSGSSDDNGELEALRDTISGLNDALSQVKSDRDSLQSENEALASRCAELVTCSASNIEDSDLERELQELRNVNEDLHAQIEELKNVRSDESAASSRDDSGVAQQTLKVMRKNMELASLNEELGNKLTSVVMNLDEARSEVQRLRAIGEQELLAVKRELQEELQRVKGELHFQKAKFRDLGAAIMERFFAE
jgi:chromosome segregation ATPase